MSGKVTKFESRKQYRFVRDYTYDLPPFQHTECHKGDVATFDGPNMGMARFYIKKNDQWELLLIKPRKAFSLFESVDL